MVANYYTTLKILAKGFWALKIQNKKMKLEFIAYK